MTPDGRKGDDKENDQASAVPPSDHIQAMSSENRLSYRSPGTTGRSQWASCLIVALIALTLAIAVLVVVMRTIAPLAAPSSVTFHIVNHTSFPIDSFVFTGSQGSSELAPIKPGETRDIKVKTAYNFDYKYSGVINGQLITGVAEHWIDEDAQGRTSDKDFSIESSTGSSVVIKKVYGQRD